MNTGIVPGVLPHAGTAARPRIEYIWDLVSELVVRDIKIRYKRSVLGIGWSLLNPLLQVLVFYLVFRWIVPTHVKDFALYLFVGILAWNWFQSSLFAATTTITDNRTLVQQPGFPVAVLPIVAVTTNLINFLLAAPIVVVALQVGGFRLTSAILLLPFIVMIQFLLSLALSYAVAALHVPYRDTQYLLGIFLFLGFYFCPVFYRSQDVPAAVRGFYDANPLVHIMDGYRSIVLYGHLPAAGPLLITSVCVAALLPVTYAYFIHASNRFIEEL